MGIEEIRETLNGADSVALTLNDDPREQELLLREVLRIFFRDKGSTVYLFPETPGGFRNKWFPLLGNNYETPALSSEISVRLPKNRFNVKEIGYEEDDNFLTLKITAKDNENKEENIDLNIKPVIFDVLVCFGSLEIDLNNFKEKIILTAGDKTLSEKISEIVEPAEKENIPNLLLAALLLETNNFREKVTEGSLNLAQNLLARGADKKAVDEIIKKDLSFSFAQILGRALARTRLNESLQSNWIFIASRDFEKTGVNADLFLIHQLLNKIKEIVPSQPVFVVLWEDKERNVWALEKRETSEKTTGPYKSFSEGELKIQETLKEMI